MAQVMSIPIPSSMTKRERVHSNQIIQKLLMSFSHFGQSYFIDPEAIRTIDTG